MLYQPTESISTAEVKTTPEELTAGLQHSAITDYKLIDESKSQAVSGSKKIKNARPENYHLWVEPTGQTGLDTNAPYDIIHASENIIRAERVHKNSIDNLNWFVTGISVLVPALIFIINATLSNSLYLSCIFSALALATISIIYSILSFQYKANGMLTTYMKKGIGFVMLSLVIIFSYFQFLEYSTIIEPQFSEERIQTGFGLNTFSLTSEGLQLSQKYPNKTELELMQIVDGFNLADATKILWKNWTIQCAGISLHLLYMGLFLTWIIGLSYLIKDKKRITADFFKMKLEFNKIMDCPSMS